MPRGVYRHTKLSEETKRKMSVWRKAHPNRYWLGKKHTAEHIAKRVASYKPIASACHMGQVPWNKGLKGKDNPLYGIPRPPHIQAVLAARRGRKASPATRLRLRVSHLGKRVSDATRAKMAETARRNRAQRSGPNSHLWRGGLTALTKLIRSSAQYAQWRTAIFRRDNFTCIFCGEHGGELNADHFPITFSEIIRGHNITTIADALACVELWDTNNGRTLCRECHLKTPTFGGRSASHPHRKVITI